MAVEWYVNQHGKVSGPFSSGQLRMLAGSSQISRKTAVRKGKEGPWVPAARIKGLYPDVRVAPAPDTAAPGHHPLPPSPAAEDGIFLTPLRRRGPRLIIFALLVLLILIGGSPWYQKTAFVLSMGLLLGTYPVVQVGKTFLERTMIVFFYPVHTQRWHMREFVRIETELEQRIADTIGLIILFVWFFWLLCRVFDYLMPWVGGDYKLWLRTDDDRLLVWQGNNEYHFKANLETLESVTGLRVG